MDDADKTEPPYASLLAPTYFDKALYSARKQNTKTNTQNSTPPSKSRQGLSSFHHRCQVRSVRIPCRAIFPNLPLLARQNAQLAHLYHRKHELLEEQSLVNGEALDNLASPLVGVQILVGSEEALSVHEIDVVLVVEHVRAANVEHGGAVGGGCGADGFEVFGKCLVHGRVLRVEPVGEGSAVANSDRVAAGEGYDVGGVEFLCREGGEEVGGVGCRGWKVRERFVHCCKPEPVSPSQGDVIVRPT